MQAPCQLQVCQSQKAGLPTELAEDLPHDISTVGESSEFTLPEFFLQEKMLGGKGPRRKGPRVQNPTYSKGGSPDWEELIYGLWVVVPAGASM